MSQPVKFTAPEKLPEWDKDAAFTLMVFDTGRLRSEWAKNHYTYIESHDIPDGHKRAFARQLARKAPFGMPVIRLTHYDNAELLDFYDGRHRTAFLAGKGYGSLPAVVETSQKERLMTLGLAREPTAEESLAIKRGTSFPQADTLQLS